MTPRFSFSSADRRAFTLLELLVATAISAIVLLVINATFFGALRLHNTTHDHIDRDLVVQRTLGIVRGDLTGLMLPGGVISGQFQTMPTDNIITDAPGDRLSPDLYTTTATIDGWNPFSEVQIVSYYLAPETDGSNNKSLVRVVARNILPVQESPTDQQVLLHGIATASLQYFDGTDWTDAWDSATSSTLPTAIKLQLVLAPLDASQPLPDPVELVVAVPVVTKTSVTQAAGGTGT